MIDESLSYYLKVSNITQSKNIQLKKVKIIMISINNITSQQFRFKAKVLNENFNMGMARNIHDHNLCLPSTMGFQLTIIMLKDAVQ